MNVKTASNFIITLRVQVNCVKEIERKRKAEDLGFSLLSEFLAMITL